MVVNIEAIASVAAGEFIRMCPNASVAMFSGWGAKLLLRCASRLDEYIAAP